MKLTKSWRATTIMRHSVIVVKFQGSDWARKKRRYDIVSTCNPGVENWQTHLENSGNMGGWKAKLITVGDAQQFFNTYQFCYMYYR